MHKATSPPAQEHFHIIADLDASHADLQMGDFLDEFMAHLKALSRPETNLSIKVHVKVLEGIDDAKLWIALENSLSLKVGAPQAY
jgi:hypothetical protein